MTKKSAALENVSFEDALGELEKIVRQLETGGGDLAASIEAYERGIALKKHCESKLQEAQMRIEKITVGADGSVSATPFKTEN